MLYIIPVAVPPISDVVTSTYTVVPLARDPLSTFTVKLAPLAPSLAEYVVELNPIVTPDTELIYIMPVSNSNNMMCYACSVTYYHYHGSGCWQSVISV